MRLVLGSIAIGLSLGGCIISEEGSTGTPSHSTYSYTNTCSTGGSGSGVGGTSSTAGSSAAAGYGAAAGSTTTPPPPPACSELPDESACEGRADCQPIYAGTDCSCGPNCTCFDGAEGCVCEHFSYFVCAELDALP